MKVWSILSEWLRAADCLLERALRRAPCASMRSSDSMHPDEAPEPGGNMVPHDLEMKLNTIGY